MRRKRIVAILMLLLISSVFTLSACKALIYYDDPARYSTAQHVDRIKKIVQEKYIGDGEFTDFAVYPLYDKGDNVIMYLVEFEPCGYYYILAAKPNMFTRRGMYVRHDERAKCEWERYRISETQPGNYEGIEWKQKTRMSDGEEVVDFPGKWFETSEGEFVKFNVSPYKAANVENQKRYLLSIDEIHSVPAVRKNNKFFNLISMEEFNYSNTLKQENTPCAEIWFWIKSEANL